MPVTTVDTAPSTTLIVYNGADTFCAKVSAGADIPDDDHAALAAYWDQLGDILTDPYTTDARIIASAHQSALESGAAYDQIAAADDVVAAQAEFDRFYAATC